jgi:hypothetical protein
MNEKIDFSLVTAENEYLAEKDPFSIHRPSLWPSEASVKYNTDKGEVVKGKCIRASYYRNMGFQTDYPMHNAGSAEKWDLGKTIEKQVIERWKKMGIYVANNIKFFHKEIVLSGELDCIIRNPLNNKLIGVEVKSYYGGYANLEICGRRRPPIPGYPKIENFLQAAIYKHKFMDQLDEYRLYYKERGDGHRVEFEVGLVAEGETFRPYWRQIEGPYWSNFSQDKVMAPFLMEDIYDRYRELITYLKNKKLPPKDYKEVWTAEEIEENWMLGNLGKVKYEKWQKNKTPIGDWQCSYCDWANQCKNDSIGE